jgi:hypothetical protein
MNNSDIIAVIAIVVSGIISVTTIISSFLINRANISAKRDEMAFTEQLKAFASITEQITDIEYQRNSLQDLDVGLQSMIVSQQIQEIDDKVLKLLKGMVNASIFLPSYIAKDIREYIKTLSDALRPQAQLRERVNKVSSCNPNVNFISKMREFIGVKE